jgi:hypothetical protein
VPTPPPVIGASGGTLTESSGATVTFPAGAITDDTTFRIARDSTGAPPLPASLAPAGSMYVITPHGGDFAQPVEVSIPVPSVTLLPTQQLKLAKAQPDGEWEVLADSTVVDGKLEGSVGSFSFFTTVVITYPLPVLQLEPFVFTSTLSCGEQQCASAIGPLTATYSVTHNGGQLPADCANPTMETRANHSWTSEVLDQRPLGTFSVSRAFSPSDSGSASIRTALRCPGYTNVETARYIAWTTGPYSPNIAVLRMPDQVDVVEGLEASVEAVLGGGAVRPGPGSALGAAPTATNRAIIDWQRSDDAGASWRWIAQSLQDEANPLPFGTGQRWRPWGVKHGFIATMNDQGALLRLRACYATSPTAEPACVTSNSARINVLQESAVPKIVDPPRSVLIRTAETANFSVTVSGTPAPTLRWQTRAANSTGEWSDVVLGSGGTSSNYTTPRLATPDNGAQYRVVATNAAGSAASSPVTVSVSDLDIAPSITTQPASLNVTSGNDAVFAVVAYGTEALSYQWRFNGANIDGANSAVLRLSSVTAESAGNYSVAVSNGAGNAVSNAAALSVSAGTPAAVAPSIVTQPAAVTVNVGNTATFAVGVDGTGPFTFQWRRDGVNVAGANSASLTFSAVALPNAGAYSVVVTNSAGTVTSNAVTLDVAASVAATAPAITSQPSAVIVAAAGSATLALGATGSGPLSYQWSLNGSALPGATLPVLTLANVGPADVGSYTVSVSNSLAAVTSQAAQLILLGAPAITQEPAATTALEGNTATFSVTADGSGLRYQWLRNGTPVAGANSASYTTPSLVAANTGAVYSVMIYNGAGLVTSQGAVLTVQVVVAPSVTQQPASTTIQPGETAQICATFGGTVPMVVHFQRWDGSSWAPYIDSSAINNNAQCFATPALTLGENGAQFRVVAINPAGQAASNAMTVTVASPGISTTTLVSVELDGGEPDYYSGQPSISADGRYVAFTSAGTNLIAGGTNASNHAYVRDLTTGKTTLINQTTSGGESSHGVQNLELSANGRYAVFTSFAKDLVANDTNNYLDVFRRDLLTGTTERVTVFPNGGQLEDAGNGNFDARLAISGDGRYVTFIAAYDFAEGGTGAETDTYYLYYRDMQTGITRLVDGTSALSPPGYVEITENGRYIAYLLNVPAPSPQTLWLYDTETHQKRVGYTYQQPAYPGGQRQGLSISSTGRYIAFAVNSVDITGSTVDQVMVVDLDDPDTPVLVSTGSGGAGTANSAYPQISGDGRYVLFETYAPNLTGGLATPSRRYSVVRDLVAGTTNIASMGMDGAPAPLGTFHYGSHALSSDGKTVAYEAGQVYATPRP